MLGLCHRVQFVHCRRFNCSSFERALVGGSGHLIFPKINWFHHLVIEQNFRSHQQITHNIGVVAQLCNRIAVMYAGNVVESGLTQDVLRSPKHPYTQGLLQAIPDETIARGELVGAAGSVPSLITPPPGCRFAPRCAHATEKCTLRFPPAISVAPNHEVSCVLYE